MENGTSMAPISDITPIGKVVVARCSCFKFASLGIVKSDGFGVPLYETTCV